MVDPYGALVGFCVVSIRPPHQHRGRHGVAVGAGLRALEHEVRRLQRRRRLRAGHTGQRRHGHVRLPAREHDVDRRALLLRHPRLRGLRHHGAGGHGDGRHRRALLQVHMDLVHRRLGLRHRQIDHRRHRVRRREAHWSRRPTNSPAARMTASATAPPIHHHFLLVLGLYGSDGPPVLRIAARLRLRFDVAAAFGSAPGSASKSSPGPALVPIGVPAAASPGAMAVPSPRAAAAAPAAAPGHRHTRVGQLRDARRPEPGDRGGVLELGHDQRQGRGRRQGGRQRTQPGRQAGGVQAGRHIGRRGPGQHVVQRAQQVVVRQGLPDAGGQRPHGGVLDEGHHPRHGLIEDQRQRVDVGPAVDRLPLGRLGA